MIGEFIREPAFLLALTFGLFWLNGKIQFKLKTAVYNPLLVTAAMLIAFLAAVGVTPQEYERAGRFIDFWLQPAIVALAIPLYAAWPKVKSQLAPILASQFVGSIVGIVSVVWIVKGLGAPDLIATSLAPKSVTAPIALAVSRNMGGLDGLTVVAVIVTGVLGNIFGFAVMKRMGVVSPMARSISMGSASHAIGTAAALGKGAHFGAFSAVGMVVNGVMTAVLAPIVTPWLL